MSMCELKSEPVSSSKQEFDKLRFPESACNVRNFLYGLINDIIQPFKDMNDLMRHNSPPNTTMVNPLA